LPIDPVWLTANGGVARNIAREIVGENRWDGLPVLADSLEEAGCSDADMLAHLRDGHREPARCGVGCGCWVIDRLLGNEALPPETPPAEPPASVKRWWQFWR
jgi:hypothetical protein